MASELIPGVWLLELGWSPPFASNAYLVDAEETTLVDAGFPLNARRIRAEIRATGLGIADIDQVLITHFDIDHLGGLSRLVPELSAPIYIGRNDLELLNGEYNPPLFHHKGLFHRMLRVLYRSPNTLSYRPVEDRDQIGEFIAIHTPGHNPGHTVYIHPRLEVAFLGDLVWEENGSLTLPFILDSYNTADMRQSVQRLAAESPTFEVACVAHGSPIRDGGFEALQRLADELSSQ